MIVACLPIRGKQKIRQLRDFLVPFGLKKEMMLIRMLSGHYSHHSSLPGYNKVRGFQSRTFGVKSICYLC
jgi:hypothetical protein